MQAKLTITTTEAGENGIFIYTDCDYSYINDTAQISYKDLEHGVSVTIGLNRDKISLLRVKEVIGPRGLAYDKQFNVLNVTRPEFKEMVDADAVEILCLADNIGYDYNDNAARISMRCFIGVYGGKPVPAKINIICRAVRE